MATNEPLPSKSNAFLLPETPSSGSSKSSFAFSSYSSNFEPRVYKGYNRSKSLSNIVPENYSAGEIRRMKERLLRTTSHLQPSAIRHFTSIQKLTLAMLAVVDFFCFCSMSIMAPFFPKEAAEKGLSDTMSGIVFSFFALVMFITSPVFGKLLPKLGAKFVFLMGMFVAGVCNLLFGMLEYVTDYTLFTTMCLIIRGFEALGGSAFSTASYVFIINAFPNNMGAVIGILETFVGLGMSTGPVLGGFLYSVGGFQLPFIILGVAMIAIVPLNMWLLPVVEELETASSSSSKKASVVKLVGVPAVSITGLIVVIISSVWSFLDPTLEPHLRQFNLTPEKIGLTFLLFSSLYGISSPCWGWLADKWHNHWSMMVAGLFMGTVGLLLLGPCPYIPNIPNVLWLNLVALSLLGLAVALTLIPTFQAILTSAIQGGYSDSVSTYGVVAGVWSSMYSLGEVVGPLIGGFMLDNYGFPVSATLMAATTFFMGVITFFFFVFKSFWIDKEGCSDSGISESWRSQHSEDSTEFTPLLSSSVSHRDYTEEKIQYYEQSRKQDNKLGDLDYDQLTDVRGTVSITSKGACEV